MGKKRFESRKNAEEFCKKVKGNLNDLREIPEAKSKYSVTYKSQKKFMQDNSKNWSPEDDRDFGYPNDFWK